MRLNEIKSTQPSKQQKVKQFADWAIQRLKIKKPPQINYSNDFKRVASHRTFGTTLPTGEVWVYLGNRNAADIMRTLCHELVHVLQFELGTAQVGMSEEQRLAVEDQANALAGRMMRQYGKQHVDIYEGRTGSLQHEVSDSLPQAFVIPELNSSNAYDQYKFAVAIAGARGKLERDKDNITPFNGDHSLQRDWADNMVIISFDPHIEEVIDQALKKVGMTGKRRIGVSGSRESSDVEARSPVRPFKGYPRR
jgi:hypothetical protein